MHLLLRVQAPLAISGVQLLFHRKSENVRRWSRPSTAEKQPAPHSHLSSPPQSSQTDTHLCSTSWRPFIQRLPMLVQPLRQDLYGAAHAMISRTLSPQFSCNTSKLSPVHLKGQLCKRLSSYLFMTPRTEYCTLKTLGVCIQSRPESIPH